MSDHPIVPLSESSALESVQMLCNIVRAIREKVFVEGTDYGVIPGTGPKPVLLLPGMEKLLRALRLRPEYALLSNKEDFETPLFYFRYECRLIEIETGQVVSCAIGSANSMEAKWRWREAKRVCPLCGKETINRSKRDDGWYCWLKIGGCGGQFAGSDSRITEQQVGRVENPDIYDQLNTIDKIAQKRALASAIKIAANVSEFFTVDVEDMYQTRLTAKVEDVVDGEYTEVMPPHVNGGNKPWAKTPERRSPAGGDADAPNDDPSGWWRNVLEVRRVKGNLMAKHHLTLETAMQQLGARLSDFATADDLLAAVAAHLAASSGAAS